MRVLNRLTCTSLLATALAFRPVDAPSVGIVHAQLYTLTGGDNKDHDTCVFVKVYDSAKRHLLAHLDGGACAGDDAEEYNDHSPHTIALIVDDQNITSAAAAGFIAVMGSRAHGNDKWVIDDARVALEFADKATLVAEWRGDLNSRGSNLVWSPDFAAK